MNKEIEKILEEFDKEFLCDPQSDFDKVITIISPEINGSSSPIYTTMRAEIKNFIEKQLQQERERIIKEIRKNSTFEPGVSTNGWYEIYKDDLLKILNKYE